MSSGASHSNITILIVQLLTTQKLKTLPTWNSDLFLPSCDNSLNQLQQFSETMWTFIISVFTWMQSTFVDITFSVLVRKSCCARQEGSVVRQKIHRQMQFQNPSIVRNKHMLLISFVGATGNGEPVSFFVRVTHSRKLRQWLWSVWLCSAGTIVHMAGGIRAPAPPAFLVCLIERWLSCQRVHLTAK